MHQDLGQRTLHSLPLALPRPLPPARRLVFMAGRDANQEGEKHIPPSPIETRSDRP